uniref:Uncharacterized protein n=1 Tax=Leersia perrieri TaxID=77586 RepID=A0A0D9VUU1_9ORYZ
MGFLCSQSSPASFSLLCDESSESVFGADDCGVEEMVPELEKMMVMSPGFSTSLGLQLGDDGDDDLVGSFMEKEVEQMVGTARGQYLEKLRNGGIELSCRIAAIDWICKVQAHYNFGPLCAYLAVNYLDRFLSSVQLSVTNDMPWMQQLLIVACLSVAAKMEETTVLSTVDLQVFSSPEYVFDAKTIRRMETVILTTLKWRMQAVTPFSYIDHFLHKINEGKPLTCELVSRCTELILGTMKATEFLKFRPSEIATAVALSVVTDGRVLDLGSVLESYELPVDKENVGRCHQAMLQMALVTHTSTESPSGVLDTSRFTSKELHSRTPGTSQQVDNNNQDSTPASKRTRLGAAPMS